MLKIPLIIYKNYISQKNIHIKEYFRFNFFIFFLNKNEELKNYNSVV